MTFKRARTEQQISARQKEILHAAKVLYVDGGLDAVTFTAISNKTCFTRPAIYSYYKKKEDVILALVNDEFMRICKSLNDKFDSVTNLSTQELASVLYDVLAEDKITLKLIALNYACIEQNCEMGSIVDFKKTFCEFKSIIKTQMQRLYPNTDERIKETFPYLLISLIINIYPLSHPTDKQQQACLKVDPNYTLPDFETLFKAGLELLCSKFKA